MRAVTQKALTERTEEIADPTGTVRSDRHFRKQTTHWETQQFLDML